MAEFTLDDMIRESLDDIHAWIDAGGGIFTLDDVDWDHPAAENTEPIFNEDEHASDARRRLKASHAIGFICGVAAERNVTPKELLWSMGVDTDAISAKATDVPARALPPTTKTKRARKRA